MYWYTVKSHFKALGLNITSKGVLGGLINRGGLISGWAYKRNKKNVLE